MTPELYLASKRIWTKQRRIEASVWKNARKAIREAEQPLTAAGTEFSAWMVVGSILLAGIMLIAGCRAAHAEVDCTDRGLTPQLKQACVELVKICDEVGCTVSTRGKT